MEVRESIPDMRENNGTRNMVEMFTFSFNKC